MTPGEPLAEVTRNDVRSGREHVESVHTGHLVVTGPDGEVLGSIGDPHVAVFVRSTVKPLQATRCLELAGDAASDLTSAEVAVAWSSHRGEAAHVEAVARLLARSGTGADDLTCPPAVPAADRAAAAARITHNCSGKHAMFALAGASLGVRADRLLDPDGDLQRELLADLDGVLGGMLAVGVDGCGAPAVAAPLAGIARAFARVASEERYRPVREAGLAHPLLVAGTGRIETALLAAGVVAKSGAEGSYGVGWIAPDGGARGLVVRAADGSLRGSSIAVIDLLQALGVVPEATWSPPAPLGGGAPAGRVRVAPGVAALATALAG